MKNFEERLTALEEIAEKMREGNIPLDEAVSLFEKGITLARGLEKDLARIEKKIEILAREPETPDDEPSLELFPDMS
jgi:exodeoxyribonuclease VII small subunit